AAAKARSRVTAPTDSNDDNIENESFAGICQVCGTEQTFFGKNRSLREGFKCSTCKSSLRYRGQADAILRSYASNGARCIADLVREPSFAALDLWEPGVLGPFREHFALLPKYIVSDFWPDVEPGQERDGVRCEDLMAPTLGDASVDLIV